MKKIAIIFAMVFSLNLFVPMMFNFLPQKSEKKESVSNELVTIFQGSSTKSQLLPNGIIVDFFN